MKETHSKYFFNDQNTHSLQSESEVILITDEFSTPANIGSIIRLAANVGSSKVIVVGSEECRSSKIKKTAGAAMGHIELEHISKEDFICPDEFTLVALETAEGAEDIYKVDLPSKLALVLGNEKHGVSHELLKICEQTVYIPMPGVIKSMNVSHAASVCLFEWARRNINSK